MGNEKTPDPFGQRLCSNCRGVPPVGHVMRPLPGALPQAMLSIAFGEKAGNT